MLLCIKFMKNPFEFGRELDSQEVVNRLQEMSEVSGIIETGGKLFVIGPRRFGKTSLLNAVAEKAHKEGDIVLSYNAESFSDIEQLVKKIIEDSAKMLKGKVEITGEKVKNYFASLRPEISFSVTQTEWKAALGANVAASASNPTSLLADALNGLENLAADQPEDTRVALIIDEFQEILAADKLLAEKQIRSAIQKHRRTAYIFAGSKTRMLTEMITDPSRPFYRLGKMLYVDVLPRPEFTRFLVDKFASGDFFAPKTVAEEKKNLALLIIKLAEDVPYNVQLLAHNLWNDLTQIKIGAPEKAVLSEDLISKTLDRTTRQADVFYTQVWNALTANQKKALIAVAAENGQNLHSRRVTGIAKVSASAMQRSLESLTNQDILRQEEKSGTIGFRFEDPFFAHWIKLFVN